MVKPTDKDIEDVERYAERVSEKALNYLQMQPVVKHFLQLEEARKKVKTQGAFTLTERKILLKDEE